jgi:hypothetical protein
MSKRERERVLSSVGSLTPYPGRIIGIDCLLAHAPEDHPDNVALGVDVQHLTTVPLIDADVCWGHPSGHAEAQFSYDLRKCPTTC